MLASLLFRVTQAGYSLALGVWVGALVMLGLTAITAFGVIPRYEPVLMAPPFGEPAFEGRGGTVLAGAVVNASLMKLAHLGLAAVAVAAACVAAQTLLFPDRLVKRGRSASNTIRVLLLAILAALVLYERFDLGPALREQLATMYDPDASSAARASARVVFDMLHTRSELLHRALLLLAASALVVSPFAIGLRSPREREAH